MATRTIASVPQCHTLTIGITFLVFLASMQTSLSTDTTKSSTQTYKTFIKGACNSTMYPSVCYKSLATYASAIKTDPMKLSSTALSVTLQVGRNVSSSISNLSKQRRLSSIEAAIIKDCVEEIGDSIDELRRAINAFGQLSGPDAEFQMDNIKTWLSTALTDEDTCTSEFDEHNISSAVKSKIKKKIKLLARHTSNALAIINRLKY